MNTAQLNGVLSLTYPDGFHVMTAEEMTGYQFYSDAPGWCISDPDRHVMLSVSWKKTAGILAMMVKPKDVAVNMEQQISRAMGQYDYHSAGFLSRKPGGKEAEGFRYTYRVGETDMTGESYCVKNKSTFYYLHFYYRTAMAEESLKVVEEILDSASWAG